MSNLERGESKARAGHAAPKGIHSRGGIRDRYYLTRDSAEDGTPSDTIDVWLTRPIRHRISADGGYMWVPSDEQTWRTANRGGRAHWRTLTLAQCVQLFGSAPSSDAVCMLLDEIPMRESLPRVDP